MRRRVACVVLGLGLAATTAQSQIVRGIFDAAEDRVWSVAIDDAGSAVYAISTFNSFGTNPGHRKQIVRWDPATGVGTQLTDFDEGVEWVSVSDDGAWLAFVSQADPLGTNHDESPELFVMNPDATGLAQLTSENLLPFSGRGVQEAVISGSGNRIVFVGAIDPLGTNPTYSRSLFVIDVNGSNLRQLRTGVELANRGVYPYGDLDRSSIDISDDGSKIVYMQGAQLGGINANGTGNHTFTSTTNAAEVSISGNGAKIAYVLGAAGNGAARVRTFDGNPGTIVSLGEGQRPQLTDDATLVYLYREAVAPAGIWKVASTGGAFTSVAPGLRPSRLAGSGARVASRVGGTWAYQAGALVAIDGTGGNLAQLSTTPAYRSAGPAFLSSDGGVVRFPFAPDLGGVNPGLEPSLVTLDVATGAITQVSIEGLGASWDEYSISDAGVLVFSSRLDLTGQNPCLRSQIFRREPDGSGLVQLTECGTQGAFSYPTIRPDGQLVVYYGYDANGWLQAFAMNPDGTGKTPLTTGSNGFEAVRPSVGNGPLPAWTTFAKSDSNGYYQIFRAKSDGSAIQQITSNPGSDDRSSPSISSDGDRIAWTSRFDPAGQNPDGSIEVFLWDGATSTIRQLTNDVVLDSGEAVLSQSGEWVFLDRVRIHVDIGIAEPISGFGHPTSFAWATVPSATGSRWIFSGSDVVDANPSSYYYGVFFADRDAAPAFTVGKASPTVLAWDPAPESIRYDVVRGSISSLSINGSDVALGPVTCLEDDSPDSHTRGHGDPADPAPGQAYFYLYRGSIGEAATSGSYGQGTGGRERVAGAGGCGP